MRSSALLVAALGLACASQTPEQRAEPTHEATSAQLPHFIEDDFPAALAQARDQHKPLFVDAWAPW